MATVKLPQAGTSVDEQARVLLTARNTSDRPQPIRFWPVGFGTALSLDMEAIRAAEWDGTLDPGEERGATLTVRPTEDAADHSFPVGLAIINPESNTLSLADLRIKK